MSASTVDVDQATERTVILAVGEVSGWRARGNGLPMDSNITFAEFHQIDAILLDELKPDVVLSPVMCSSFDCLDLARTLGDFGFAGRYRVMVGDMPNPDLIRNEIRACCPRLDFDMVSVALTQNTTLN